MTPVWRNRAIGLGIAAVVYALDRFLKWVVAYGLELRHVGMRIELLPFFDLTRTHNPGISLGMFPANSPEMRWGLVALTAMIALIVFVWLLRERKLFDIAGLALILGGAVGNIHDRWRWGYVLDYADFHIGSVRPFMVFNLADAAITFGVLIILARALFMREKPPAPQDDGQADQPAETSSNA